MRNLLESEKNFIVCSALTVICGVLMICIGRVSWGIICLLLGVAFGISAAAMIVKNNKKGR